jgi:hypothetical protein
MTAKRTIRPSSDRCGTGVDAAAGNRFYATISTDPKLPERLRDDAEPCHVIAERGQDGKVISVKRRSLYDAADIAHEVEQLNKSDAPVSRRSRGRLSVRNRVKDGGRFAIQSPTEIVVRLVDPNNPTADRLRTLQQTRGKLDRSELPALIAQVTNEWKAFTDLDALPLTKRDLREDQIRRLLASVGKQLTDKYGV